VVIAGDGNDDDDGGGERKECGGGEDSNIGLVEVAAIFAAMTLV